MPNEISVSPAQDEDEDEDEDEDLSPLTPNLFFEIPQPPFHQKTMATSTSKPQSKNSKSPPPSSLSSHLAMVELKTRILTSLSKLSDRDTHQIAADDLEKTIKTLPSDGVSMLLNSLTHDPNSSSSSSSAAAADSSSSSSVYRRETLRLLALLASTHPDPTSAHLPKMMAHIVRRLKDPASDSAVRDACRDAAGSLAGIYLKGQSEVAGLFVRPLLEVMGEQSKTVQAGAAGCLARVVECAGGGAASMFQRLCPRICKLVGGQGVIAKGALLSVFSSLAQVGAISPQSMPAALQSIRECLDNSDWATRKAAADTLTALASHSSQLIADGSASTIAALEACRFDKVKPVRDSMMEALQIWKEIAGKGGDDVSKNSKGDKNRELVDTEEKKSTPGHRRSESVKDSSGGLPTGADSVSKERGNNIPEKAASLLKKKVPSLTDKELNPEFFQKLETRSLDDLPVEVVVPRRCVQSSHTQGEEPNLITDDSGAPSNHNGIVDRESSESQARRNINYLNLEKRLGEHGKLQDTDNFARDKWTEHRGFRAKDLKTRAFDADDRAAPSQRDPTAARLNFSRSDGHTDGSFMNGKGNWLVIQRQLSQLERQQANLMNMLQDFMGGSHDSMVTLENRVRGLERVVEEMARDLSLSSGRRSSNMMLGFEGSPGRSSIKYNGGVHDYSGLKFGRGGDSRMLFAERFLSSENMISGVRGRDPPWRSDSEGRDSYGYTGSRNVLMSSRRSLGSAPIDSRSPRTAEHSGDQPGSRRAWDKGQGPFRLGEGPSARSVWQASKDEATLEAIRVAGEDNGSTRIATRAVVPELDVEALTDDNSGPDRGPLWASWTHAMDSLHVGDVDSAYAQVLSSGDDMLLVKLMERSGPIMDQLSSEVASEVLHAVGQFLLEQSLFDISLTWIQQLTELIVDNGADFLDVPLEVKKEILLSLHDASGIDLPEDWEGATVDQILMQLASSWEIDIQQLVK